MISGNDHKLVKVLPPEITATGGSILSSTGNRASFQISKTGALPKTGTKKGEGRAKTRALFADQKS